jgi:hypothetical protein
MRVKVIATGLDPYTTRVVNSETDEPIKGVRSVSFCHDADSFPTLRIEIIDFDLDAVGEAIIDRVYPLAEINTKLPA